MSEWLPEFGPYRDSIPDFVVKLYHILEDRNYEDYIRWQGDDQILIRSSRKMEEKVLPHFFRHRHMTSFVRQLNMYHFGKVNKFSKSKTDLLFHNPLFVRGKIHQMTRIQRTNRKGASHEEPLQKPESPLDQEASIQVHVEHAEPLVSVERNEALHNYRAYVRSMVGEITGALGKIDSETPEVREGLEEALRICERVEGLGEGAGEEDPHNLTTSMRIVPRIESLILSSQNSICHLG